MITNPFASGFALMRNAFQKISIKVDLIFADGFQEVWEPQELADLEMDFVLGR